MFDIEIKLLMLAMRSDDLTVMNLKMTLLDVNWPCRENMREPFDPTNMLLYEWSYSDALFKTYQTLLPCLEKMR